jgi:hypothetical protein
MRGEETTTDGKTTDIGAGGGEGGRGGRTCVSGLVFVLSVLLLPSILSFRPLRIVRPRRRRTQRVNRIRPMHRRYRDRALSLLRLSCVRGGIHGGEEWDGVVVRRGEGGGVLEGKKGG